MSVLIAISIILIILACTRSTVTHVSGRRSRAWRCPHGLSFRQCRCARKPR